MHKLIMLLLAVSFLSGCVSPKEPVPPQPAEVQAYLQENPAVLLDFLKEHKTELLVLVEEAGQQREMDRFLDQIKQSLAAKPLTAEIQEGRMAYGNPQAATTVVVYSDLLCHYCKQGDLLVQALAQNFGQDLRIEIKHMAMQSDTSTVGAVYLEALNRIAPEKARQLYHTLFDNQDQLQQSTEILFTELAKTGVDMDQLQKLATSEEIQALVVADKEEAELLGITGTPTFLINGIKIQGAIPFKWMKAAIELIQADQAKAQPAETLASN